MRTSETRTLREVIRARGCALRQLALGLMMVVAVFALLGSTRAEGPSEGVIVLRPGLNAVGWVDEAIGIADLFAELPEATTVYAWDPINQRYLVAAPSVPEPLWTLSDVAPGMGLLVSINGDAPVEWRLSLTPVSGTVRLWPGLNLVAWSGRDSTPLDHALRGVGTSAVGVFIKRDGAVWANALSPDVDASGRADHLDRGEALWVRSSRRLNWLQPTDALPRIIVDISLTDRDRVIHALRDVATYFDQTYGVQADPARLMLSFRSNPDWPHAGGGVNWFPVPEIDFTNIQRFGECGLANFVAHEYTHILQAQLDTTFWTGPDGWRISAGIAAPWWMKEGTAYLAADTLYRARANACGGIGFGPESADTDAGSDHLEGIRATLNDETPPLETIVRRGDWRLPGTAYTHGALALQRLTAEEAGHDSLFEFWRLLSAEDELPETRRDLNLIWRRAFESAFGLDVDEFYSDFHQWQCEQAAKNGHPETDDCLNGARRLVRGTLTFDCSLHSGAKIRLLRQAGDTWIPLNWWLTDGGYFTLAAPTTGLYLIQVSYDDIEPYFGANGINTTLSDTVPWQVDQAGIDVALSRLYNRGSCASPK